MEILIMFSLSLSLSRFKKEFNLLSTFTVKTDSGTFIPNTAPVPRGDV